MLVATDRRAPGERFGCGALAQGLEPAVVLELLAHGLDLGIGECGERRGLIAVARRGDVVGRELDLLGEQLGRRRHRAREVTGVGEERAPLGIAIPSVFAVALRE
jgi:hypothetical protein